jgi:hypothetical protein
MSTIAGITVTFALPENDTRQQNVSLGQAQDLSWKYFSHSASNRLVTIPLRGLTTALKDSLATALESAKAASIAIVDGGSGYSVNDVLTLAGGTTAVTATVTHVTATVVDAVTLLTKGSGISLGTKATTVAPAGGSACTISVETLDRQVTIDPDAHIDLGAGAGVAITAQWIDPEFNFQKGNHDFWSGVLNFMKI